MSGKEASDRIRSMDQFRGYNVAGMFVVNFLSGLTAIHPVMQHNNNYFSYADSIMPGFIFCVGFCYRLTIIGRLPRLGALNTYKTYFYRSLALIIISLVLYGFGTEFRKWDSLTTDSVRRFAAILIKVRLWEILAIIGATQIFIMPVIAASSRVRLTALVTCIVVHVLISYWFNWDFVHGIPGNRMDLFWHTEGCRAWDGGIFGIIAWAVAMLAGTLAYDMLAGETATRALRQLLIYGGLLMALGYALSCLTTLYDVEGGAESRNQRYAASPVIPPFEKITSRSFSSLLAEPPFVRPPHYTERKENYWMMGKRMVSASFILFGTGFTFFLYGLFVLICDVRGMQARLFGTLGQNALVAYIIHCVVRRSVRMLVPKDAPLWWCMVSLGVFLFFTYYAVRHLEKKKIFLRL